ncbi:hypothetical protein BC941DRAFT_508391 [Chlamydoabsidia padenii]|nr:hypothetical protein BC941DRAFT_508391 [Chlamydoabsidia padenii]
MSTNQVLSRIPPLQTNHPKDIAALFNQLQVSVDQQKTRLYDSKTTSSSKQPPTPIAEYSLISPASTNSPLTPSLMTCPCHHWLVSLDSEHCAMCDTPLAIMSLWQTERIERAKRLRAHRRQLLDMTATQQQQQNDMMVLQRTILEHREALEARDDEIISLQHDMTQLQTKYNDESAQIEAIEIAKQAAKREIEELGHQLFKEAHDMVNTEQQEKSIVASSCDKVKLQLDQAQLDLDQVSEQLQALRMDMGRWGDHQDEHYRSSTPSSSIISPTDNTSTTTASRPASLSSSAMTDTISSGAIPITSPHFLSRAKMDLKAIGGHNFMDDDQQLETFEDDQQLLDFQEFMDSATCSFFSLKKLHSLPFIKMCLSDDIEPCLRFGPHPKMTNSKRILEAIQIKTCFVERCPPGFVREMAGLLRKDRQAKKPSLWDKFGLAPDDHTISCATCGREVLDNEEDASDMERTLSYRFRISYFDEWACIDRYCANRLNSVIAFYAFLRQLRLGTYNGRSLMDVYQECSRLRLLMFLSRLGALPPSSD